MTENQAEELQAKLDVLNSIMADEMHIIQSQVTRHSELKNLIDDNTNKGMITKYIYIYTYSYHWSTTCTYCNFHLSSNYPEVIACAHYSF